MQELKSMYLDENPIISTETEKLWESQEEIQLLREQLDTLTLELLDKNLTLREIEEELELTNQELSQALTLEGITFDDARKIARTLVECELPSREALAALLSAIYSCPVTPSQLGARKMLLINEIGTPRSADLVDRSAELRTHLRAEFKIVQDKIMALQARLIDAKTNSDRQREQASSQRKS